jgi:hypothetical protein
LSGQERTFNLSPQGWAECRTVVTFGQGGLEIGGGDTVRASLVSIKSHGANVPRKESQKFFGESKNVGHMSR